MNLHQIAEVGESLLIYINYRTTYKGYDTLNNCFFYRVWSSDDGPGQSCTAAKQIREKENVVVDTNSSVDGPKAAVAKKKKTVKDREQPREDPQSETTSLKGGCEPEPNLKAARVKPVYASQTNAGLVVRQLLQRSQFGDVKDYLQSVTKPELFQQALVVATYVQELKKKHSEVSEAAHEELVQYQAKYRSVAGNLAEREQIYEEQEVKKNDEYLVLDLNDLNMCIVHDIERNDEHEEKFKTLQQTQQDQAQLIEEMSDIRRQREGQLNAVKRERDKFFACRGVTGAGRKQFLNKILTGNGRARLREVSNRIEEEQETNKILTLETQRKAQTWGHLEAMSRGVENARNQISTLNGQVQVRWLCFLSLFFECKSDLWASVGGDFEAFSHTRGDRLQQQYQIDQQDWKSTQVQYIQVSPIQSCLYSREHRDSLEKRKADEFRKMDLELRRLNQALSRMRIEWESEKSQREKSEARLHKLSSFLDVRDVITEPHCRGITAIALAGISQETKVHTQELEEETQQLKMQLNGVKNMDVGCTLYAFFLTVCYVLLFAEEKEARTSKDHALQIAHRLDFQALQKSYREQENAKLDAQSEVASLVQRCVSLSF
ncbi:hypothetical protein GQ600_26151 [Phytophthora cactorum]|nr:hypothetical protein GQ600_26151 [Phytophthora cactorum]